MPEEKDRHTPPPESSAAAIVEEAQRRVEERRRTSSWQRNLAVGLNRVVYWVARHWVGVFNVLMALYVGGAVLAPVFMWAGMEAVGRLLYVFYRPFCHQYPFRSWFLFGEHAVYPLHEPISVLAMNQLSTFVGDATTGYKMALCQRDVALYGAMLAAGLAYGALRRYGRRAHPWSPLPLWQYLIFGVLPMLLDGGIQWLSYAIWHFFPGLLPQPFETIPPLRALTGSLFGLGIIAVSYPHLALYFTEVREIIESKYGWST